MILNRLQSNGHPTLQQSILITRVPVANAPKREMRMMRMESGGWNLLCSPSSKFGFEVQFLWVRSLGHGSGCLSIYSLFKTHMSC